MPNTPWDPKHQKESHRTALEWHLFCLKHLHCLPGRSGCNHLYGSRSTWARRWDAKIEQDIKVPETGKHSWSMSLDELYLYIQFVRRHLHLFAPVPQVGTDAPFCHFDQEAIQHLSQRSLCLVGQWELSTPWNHWMLALTPKFHPTIPMCTLFCNLQDLFVPKVCLLNDFARNLFLLRFAPLSRLGAAGRLSDVAPGWPQDVQICSTVPISGWHFLFALSSKASLSYLVHFVQSSLMIPWQGTSHMPSVQGPPILASAA